MPQLMGTRNPMHDYATVLGTPSSNDWSIGADRMEAKNIPTGSEGSIQYAVSDAGDGMVWKTVAVWGDLRDFGADDTPEIDAWFARIVASPLILRGAFLVVDIEYGASYLLYTEGKDVRRVELPAEVSP